jgi:hypothetical protein
MSRTTWRADDAHVTDTSGVLRDWRLVFAAGLAVLSAAVVTLVARTGDPSTADSYLGDVRNAVVLLANGSTVTAANGQRVPQGATVRTGTDGAATLSTAGRDVYLGALTTVRVADGVHQRLERGQVMVDGRGGPQLVLDTRAGRTDVPGGALVRVETGPVLRLAVFAGKASLTAAGRERRTDVGRLYQVLASYTALPGAPTVLALTDDAWEQRLAAELVNADKDLTALAHGLAGPSGVTVLRAAPVRYQQASSAAGDVGEEALSVAVAQASRRDATLTDTLSFVTRARGEGGSWGAVAALVNARVTAVSALLDALFTPAGGTPPPDVAGPTPRSTDLFGPPSSAPGGGGGGGSTGTTSSPRPTGSSKPTPKPSASTSPTQPADDLISTVVGLLGSPSPAASPHITPLLHLP